MAQFVKKCPECRVTTYKNLARAMNSRAYRAVGSALNKNPYSSVPCHRVVNSDGKVGGFASGTEKKTALLRKEGIEIKNGKIKDKKRIISFS